MRARRHANKRAGRRQACGQASKRAGRRTGRIGMQKGTRAGKHSLPLFEASTNCTHDNVPDEYARHSGR